MPRLILFRRLGAMLRAPLLCAGTRRALIEALLLASVGSGLVYLHPELYPTIVRQTLFFWGVACTLVCALRLRVTASSWWRHLLREAVTAAGLTLINGAMLLPATLWHPLVPPDGQTQMLLVSFVLFAGGGGFLLFRAGIRLWLFWDRLRRRRLLWAFTHTHMAVVATVSLFFALMLTIMIVRSQPAGQLTPPPSPTGALIQEIATGVLPVLSILTMLVVLVLAAVLPPSALVSYIVARRATRRLEMLAAATGALRAGDYSVRVPVLGADEVARLQANFNAMAADLERAMRDLQAERDTVTALSEARRELVAGVSHELRTPVTTVRGYLESNRTRWETTPPPTLQQDMDVMLRETIRLQRLIDDLFALAQVEGGSLALRCSPTAVGQIAQQCVAATAPPAWQRDRVQILAEVDPATPPALVDAGRLEQVLYNLLRNAVRHTPPGGIVAVAVSPAAGGVQVQVQDTGAGIAPEDLPHIWERFYRAQATRAQDTAGAGLGLALVKELTEAMGGRVSVSSEAGMGSCFSVWLPYAGPVPSKVGAAAS